MKTSFPSFHHLTCGIRLLPLWLLLPVTATVQAQFTWETNNGTITITGYSGPGGAVCIPSTFNGLPVTSIGGGAFGYCTSLTNIIIPNTVTSIGYRALYWCTSLTSITIPNTVTSIGSEAFFLCTSLTCLTIPTSVTNIESGVFFGCSGLTSVTIPDNVTDIGLQAFRDCTGLTNVTIGCSVTDINMDAFSSCSSLTSVTIPISVGLIERRAFSDCTSLTAIIVDPLNAAYSSLDGVLFDKSQTTLIQCPGAKDGTYMMPGSVTNIGDNAFSSCGRLTSVTIPDSVTSIGGRSFYNCASLTGVTIPSSVTHIGESAFDRCASLTSVTIPDSVTYIGDKAFLGCTSLTAINVRALNPKYSSLDGVLFDKSQNTLIQCPGGKSGSYTIPNSVTGIRGLAFRGCTSLTAINVDALNPEYSSLGGVLFDKSQTMLIRCPGGKSGSYTIPDGVTSIGMLAFESCNNLTNITIGNSVASIGHAAFDGCTSLMAISVDALNPQYSSLDDVLFDKSQTMLIRCPGGKSGSYTIPDGVISIEGWAFSGCTSLTNITVGNSVTRILDGAFLGCTSLTAGYFEGNAPYFHFGPICVLAFEGATNATVFYLPGTTGWPVSEDHLGCPTALWVLPYPVILTTTPNFGVQTNRFGFIISWATNASVVVEASTTLSNPDWSVLETNTVTNGWFYFSDAAWTNYPSRLYRLRWP